MKTICCICHRTKEKKGWKKRPVGVPLHALSHGYCPECFRKMMERWEQQSGLGSGWDLGLPHSLVRVL